MMCYATAPLGALWLPDLARTKTTIVDGRAKEVVGKIVIGVVVGPGAMLGDAREDALVHAWKAEGEKRRCVDSVVCQLQKDGRCNGSNELCLFSEETKR